MCNSFAIARPGSMRIPISSTRPAKAPHFRTVLPLLLLGSLAACHHHHRNAPALPPPPPIVCPGIVTSGPSVFAGAPAIIAKALTGVYDRGEQDIMLRMEAKLPGFGGWFLAADTFNVYMKSPSSTSAEAVRRIFYDTYSARPEDYVKCIVALGPQVKIIQGRYSLSELIAIEHLFLHTTKRVPGFTGGGTSLVRNRVVVGFTDSASVCPGAAALASMGVPMDAIELEVWGIIRAL
jgi:hypothetical protein